VQLKPDIAVMVSVISADAKSWSDVERLFHQESTDGDRAEKRRGSWEVETVVL